VWANLIAKGKHLLVTNAGGVFRVAWVFPIAQLLALLKRVRSLALIVALGILGAKGAIGKSVKFAKNLGEYCNTQTMQRKPIKQEKIKGHLILGREIRSKNGHRRQYVLLQCDNCKKETWRRVDNLPRMVGCQCQRNARFKSDQFVPLKKHYSWEEIEKLSRHHKVGTSNIIHWLKKEGCTYEYRHASEGKAKLTEEEKEKAYLKARIGFSKSQICADLQVSYWALPTDLPIKDHWDRQSLAEVCKELRLKGWKISEIAKEMKISDSTIYRWFDRYYGTHFKEESKKARALSQKAAANKLLGSSDHHLSRHHLRRQKV